MAGTARVGLVLCAREPSLSPPRVLRQRMATHLRAPVRRRCGGGAAPENPQELSLPLEEREPVAKQPRRGNVWAQTVHAVPVPCCVSQRARDLWPAGGV